MRSRKFSQSKWQLGEYPSNSQELPEACSGLSTSQNLALQNSITEIFDEFSLVVSAELTSLHASTLPQQEQYES